MRTQQFQRIGFTSACKAARLFSACAFAIQLVLLGWSGSAAAGEILQLPTTGGTSTKTLEYRLSQTDLTTLTNEADIYSTRLQGFLADSPGMQIELVFNQPFASPTVQAGIAAVSSALAGISSQPLVFFGPNLTSSTRGIFSQSSTDSNRVLVNEEVLWVDTTELVGADTFNVNLPALGFGAQYACANFGNCENLFVAAGDTVLLTSAGILETYSQTRTLTNTFLTTETYSMIGSIGTVSAPSTGWLLVACVGSLLVRRPRKIARA